MGQGIDLAREQAPEHAQFIDNMKDQLIIVLINRLGGNIDIPISEIDGTGDQLLSMSLDKHGNTFTFKTSKKN